MFLVVRFVAFYCAFIERMRMTVEGCDFSNARLAFLWYNSNVMPRISVDEHE